MSHPTTWRCRACKVPLGVVTNGTLRLGSRVIEVGPDGSVKVGCSCGAERIWRPKSPVHRH